MMLENASEYGRSLFCEERRPVSRDSLSRGSSANSRDGLRRYRDSVLARVGVSVIGDGAELELEEREQARRIGLSAVEGSAEFSQRAVQEARDAEDSLLALRRRANMITSRCNGQLDVVDKEVRAEMEQRAIADNISRELEALRAEIRRKDAAQEEHLGNLYRAMAGPPHAAPSYALAYAVPDRIGYQADGAQVFPTLISSAVPLTVDPLSARAAHEPNARRFEDEHFGRRHVSAAEPARVRQMTEGLPARRHGVDSPYSRSQVQEVVAASRGHDAGEAMEMLRRNQEKLRYLERYGV